MPEAESATNTRDDDLVLLHNVMQATGLSCEIVDGFMMDDGDLDAMCDRVLSQLAVPTGKTRVGAL